MTPTDLLVPTYAQMLRALSRWLEKAEGQLEDPEAVLSARLAPDMFNLSTQVRFCCVQAYEAAARLKGEALPQIAQDMLDEGRQGSEAPGTLAAAKARLAETLSFLDALPADALDAGSDRDIEHKLPNGMVFDMTGRQYTRDWALPQFYFHLMTAYAILRQQGLELGKADYVSHALTYLRPGTMPKGVG